jgi:hypothetical protein
MALQLCDLSDSLICLFPQQKVWQDRINGNLAPDFPCSRLLHVRGRDGGDGREVEVQARGALPQPAGEPFLQVQLGTMLATARRTRNQPAPEAAAEGAETQARDIASPKTRQRRQTQRHAFYIWQALTA